MRCFPATPLCMRCLGSDRRLYSVKLPDGNFVQECCATVEERGPDAAPTPHPFPDEVREWVLTKLGGAPHESLTDTECTLVAIARMPSVGPHWLEYTVVAVALYEKNKPEEPKSGVWLGAVGDKGITRLGALCTESRLLEPATLPSGITIQSTLVKFKTGEGEDLVWFASGQFIPEEGKTYDIKFGIKKHELYQGHRSTVITRTSDLAAPPRKRKAKNDDAADGD
jgi:hypothetical protein